ncbi:MAG: hypothetical protein GX298_11310 [Planctomycetes bacterium]|jgi:c-di-GMP-binding flagellar brake protein YcgR|nr:hypothetical protein [Planctomycetota bacterium]
MRIIEQFNAHHIEQCLAGIVQGAPTGTLSFTTDGTWHLFEIVLAELGPDTLLVDIAAEAQRGNILKKDQPVGICLHCDHCRYLFESVILEPPSPKAPSRIRLDRPDKIERIQQRVYERHAIPANLNIRTLFWHRGYLHETLNSPTEACWQGKLENISARGAMIRVALELRECFCIGQILGLQFTPLPYHKPLLFEAGVRHLQPSPDETAFFIGVEFLGLEAGCEGREMLHRLLEVIAAYEKMNT